MIRMRVAVVGVVAMLVTGLGAMPAVAAPAGDVQVASARVPADVLGKRLATRFFRELQQGDRAGLAAFLSPAFQIQRADGTSADKGEYLANMPAVAEFALTGFDATREGDVLVVRYISQTTEVVDGDPYSTSPKPRLSVFMRNPKTGDWQLLAHANFDAMVTAK